MSAEWMDFDFEQALWIIPPGKRKTRKTKPSAHVVPLAPHVLELLRRRNGMVSDRSRWVFPAKRSAGFWRWGSAEDDAVRGRTGVTDLRAHDLRRTMATRIRALGFARETVDAVLGHREGRLAQTYQLYDHLKEKATALKAWERELVQILACDKSAGREVVPFVRGATS
jgi:integrase